MAAQVPGRRVKLASPASAGTLFVLTLAAAAASLPLAVLARQGASIGLIFYTAVVLLALVLGGVGLVVARNQPGNPMGWLMLGSGLCLVLGTDASFYATLAYRLHPGRLPLGWMAVVLQVSWALAFVLFGAAVLLFPDGRLPSWHWRWPMRVYLALGAAWVAGAIVINVMEVARHQVRIDSSGDLAVIDHPTGAAEAVVAVGNAYLSSWPPAWWPRWSIRPPATGGPAGSGASS